MPIAPDTKIITKPAAAKKLELSQVSPLAVQRETMGTDVDVQAMQLYLASQIKVEGLAERIKDARISRTVDASSLLTVIINDADYALLGSGLLYNKLDVTVDNLWFRLSGIDLDDTEVTLSFEDREIALMREYTKWRVARRSKTTRAQFVRALIDEVKEVKIPWEIPELRTTQPIERFDGDTTGKDRVIAKGKGLSLKNPELPGVGKAVYKFYSGESPATKEMMNNANIILQVGSQLGASRKVMVVAIMTAIHESRLRNLDHGDLDSLGLFQQRANWGSVQERLNPETSSKLFIDMAIKRDAQFDHGLTYEDLAYATQYQSDPNPGGKGHIFIDVNFPIRQQAETFVTAFGTPGGDKETSAGIANNMYANAGSGGEFYFYRGKITNKRGQKIRKPENTWDCIQRLADEVNWRAYFVSGVFYFMSENDMFKQKSLLTVTPYMEGVRRVSGNFYQKKRSAIFTLDVDVGRWSIPPGALVELSGYGPFDGRWIVSEYERSLFNLQATITLARERPELPEPVQGNASSINSTWIPAIGSNSGTVGGGLKKTAKGLTPKIQGTTQALAQALLSEYGKGWIDGNGRGLSQIQKLAAGMKLNGPGVGIVDQDPRTLKVVLWLIQQGYTIGTTAWTEDHERNLDGPNGHCGGHAIDIAIINGQRVDTSTSAATIEATRGLDQILNDVVGELHPRQLISGGTGGVSVFGLRALTIPNAGYYGEKTMADHCNHVHVGY